MGEWEAEPGNGGQDVLGALVSLESPGVLQAALSQPCAPVTPVSWCSLHSRAQQPLLQVHLTWFWENLASEMVPHFPSPHPRLLLWVQGGKVPVGHGSGGAPARSGLVTAPRSLVVQVGKRRQEQLGLTGPLSSLGTSSSRAEGQLS